MFTIQASQAQRVPFVVVYQSVLASAIGIIPSIWDGRIDALRCNTFVLTMQYRLGRQASLLSGINLESRGCRWSQDRMGSCIIWHDASWSIEGSLWWGDIYKQRSWSQPSLRTRIRMSYRSGFKLTWILSAKNTTKGFKL